MNKAAVLSSWSSAGSPCVPRHCQWPRRRKGRKTGTPSASTGSKSSKRDLPLPWPRAQNNGDLDRKQLIEQAGELVRVFPYEVVEHAHDVIFARGGGQVIGEAQEVSGEAVSYSTPREISKNLRYAIDRIGMRDTGEIVMTTISLNDVPEVADQIAEINWLAKRAKDRSWQ